MHSVGVVIDGIIAIAAGGSAEWRFYKSAAEFSSSVRLSVSRRGKGSRDEQKVRAQGWHQRNRGAVATLYLGCGILEFAA